MLEVAQTLAAFTYHQETVPVTPARLPGCDPAAQRERGQGMALNPTLMRHMEKALSLHPPCQCSQSMHVSAASYLTAYFYPYSPERPHNPFKGNVHTLGWSFRLAYGETGSIGSAEFLRLIH